MFFRNLNDVDMDNRRAVSGMRTVTQTGPDSVAVGCGTRCLIHESYCITVYFDFWLSCRCGRTTAAVATGPQPGRRTGNGQQQPRQKIVLF